MFFDFGVWRLGGYCMLKRILVRQPLVYVGQLLCVSSLHPDLQLYCSISNVTLETCSKLIYVLCSKRMLRFCIQVCKVKAVMEKSPLSRATLVGVFGLAPLPAYITCTVQDRMCKVRRLRSVLLG